MNEEYILEGHNQLAKRIVTNLIVSVEKQKVTEKVHINIQSTLYPPPTPKNDTEIKYIHN